MTDVLTANLMRKCPACGRRVKRWTNLGRQEPHRHRTAKHKCPHGNQCRQGTGQYVVSPYKSKADCARCNLEHGGKSIEFRQELIFIEFGEQGDRAARPALPGPKLVLEPDRVWTLYHFNDKNTPPTLPFIPVHNVNAFLEDAIHDWTLDSFRRFRYYSRVTDSPVWVLLEFAA